MNRDIDAASFATARNQDQNAFDWANANSDIEKVNDIAEYENENRNW